MPSLDGLRGLAILLVLLYHYGSALNQDSFAEHAVKQVVAVGWTGVDLFFVLSGFLITGILLDSRDSDNFFSSFYLRRILRIFPLYYFSCLFLFFVLPILNPAAPASSAGERTWYLTYLQNWTNVLVAGRLRGLAGHFWSQGIEEQFYIIWPWIVYRCKPQRLLKICAGGAVASLSLRLMLLAGHFNPVVVYRNTFTRMDALLIGALCACLLRDQVWVKRLRQHVDWMWAAPLVTLAFLRLAIHPFGTQSRGVLAFGLSAIAISYAALLVTIVLTLDKRSILQRLFSSRFMRLLGKYSYGAYIWQMIVRVGLNNLEIRLIHKVFPAFLNIPLLIGATLMVSMVSYTVLERPFLLLKRYFKPRVAADAVDVRSAPASFQLAGLAK